MKLKYLVAVIILIIVAVGGWYYFPKPKQANAEPIKIGIITDLSGGAAYWGESTRVGAEIAAKELEAEGIKIQLIFEDYALDPAKAASAAQKLTSVDNVNAVYAEFNPGAVAAGSVLKDDKNALYLFDAAVASPLEGAQNTFKTYLDYQAGCHAVAQTFKDRGIQTIGVLKVNLEFGELCLTGVKEVYGTNIAVEGYNLGDTDFRTQITKLKSEKAGAVMNFGFEGDTYNTLKGMKDLGFAVPYGTVEDTIGDKEKADFPQQLKGGVSFGFKDVDLAFSAKLLAANNNVKLATDYGAALAYTHIKQLARSLAACKNNIACAEGKMSASPSDPTIGFIKFVNRIADLDIKVKQY
jgi:ABC-type branched-subunit amino acid transport system substrate-binding protein